MLWDFHIILEEILVVHLSIRVLSHNAINFLQIYSFKGESMRLDTYFPLYVYVQSHKIHA